MEQFKVYFLIGLGSALGGMSRFGLGGLIDKQGGGVFPWGTLAVNISGCFLIGVFACLSAPEGRLWISPQWRQFLIIGLCGGYTTFSSFSLQTLNQLRDGDFFKASAHVLASVILCLLAAWAGEIAAGKIAS